MKRYSILILSKCPNYQKLSTDLMQFLLRFQYQFMQKIPKIHMESQETLTRQSIIEEQIRRHHIS